MVLKIEDISYTFKDGVQALYDVSFSLETKGFLVILGESGSGKTTLLKAIAGLIDPQKGRVYINGEDVTEEQTGSRDLSMVFQGFALYPFLSVYENVWTALNGFPLSEEEKDVRVKDILSKFGLRNYLNFKPRNLSEGQKQRVAIARVLIREPFLFLLDEPFSNLDLPQKRRIQKELKRIFEEGNSSFLYVTHEAEEAKSLADYILLLDRGRVLQFGTPSEIIQKPVSIKAAKLIYSGNVNMLPCDGLFAPLLKTKECVVCSKDKGKFVVPYRSFSIQENGRFQGKVISVKITNQGLLVSLSIPEGEVRLLVDEEGFQQKENDVVCFDVVSRFFCY